MSDELGFHFLNLVQKHRQILILPHFIHQLWPFIFPFKVLNRWRQIILVFSFFVLCEIYFFVPICRFGTCSWMHVDRSADIPCYSLSIVDFFLSCTFCWSFLCDVHRCSVSLLGIVRIGTSIFRKWWLLANINWLVILRL